MADTLWKLAWQGKASTDNFEVIRRGIASKFKPAIPDESGKGRRGGFSRWEASRPLAGNWYPVVIPENGGMLEDAEIEKDRVRLLFRRYGVLFKQILEHELPLLRWPKVFRTLRLMELSGEILSGMFFQGIPGIQFASHDAYRALQKELPEDAVYWMNACDPASLCGTGLEEFQAALPRRSGSNWVVFHGADVILTLTRDGKDLSVRLESGDPLLQEALNIFKFFLTREFNRRQSAAVETANGVPITESPYGSDLKKAGFTREYRGYTLWRKYD